MDIPSVRRAYRFYAPIYDFVFGPIVNEGRRLAVSRFPQQPGDRILETGVGTGLSLSFYQPHVSVTGIDVSPEMLEKARRHFLRPRYPQVQDLLEMDVQKMAFPDNSFQGAVAMYVASVVPDPRAMMREMFRVTEPGSPVLVVNHFASSKMVLRRMESCFAPFSRRLGFRPDFSLEYFVEVLGMEPEKVTRVNVGGYWKLLEFRSPPKKAGQNGTHGGSRSDRENFGNNGGATGVASARGGAEPLSSDRLVRGPEKTPRE